MMNFKYLRKDIKHFLVNLGTTAVIVTIFYAKFGFYGWPHIISVVFLHYAAFPIDDWIEKERPFPLYIVPMLMFAGFFFPLVTVLAILGDIVVNLRVIFKTNNFVLERLEGLGNIPNLIFPFTLPVGLNSPQLYLAAALFVTFVDSFHKIGHKESVKPKLMWITGLACLAIVWYLFRTPTPGFFILLGITLLSLIPFAILKERKTLKAYSQIWFGLCAFVGFYYYLYFVI